MALVRGPKTRLAIVIAAAAGALGVATYFFTGAGGKIPLLSATPYEITAEFSDVDNMVQAADIRMAGVHAGQVQRVEHDGHKVRVTMGLDDAVAPLHQGATARVGSKTLIGETYVDITDGAGPELADGAALPPQAIKPNTQLRDVLASLDAPTRDALGSTVRSASAGLDGRKEDLQRTLAGLGKLGNEGHTALDAVAAQSEDIKKLAGQATQTLRALDTGRGDAAQLVTNAQRITRATADQRRNLEQSVQALPGVLGSARTATGQLTDLTGSLAPVAGDLNAAAPGLNTALTQLPATTRDLRSLLPDLDATLGTAPATLQRAPRLASDLRGIIPAGRDALADINPMLRYIKPYGRDLASFFANFASILQYTDERGVNMIRLQPLLNEQSVKGLPVPTGMPLTSSNAYPSPGMAQHPQPFAGPYPRITREPR